MEMFAAVLAALIAKDFIHYFARVLDWRWSVNKGYPNNVSCDMPLRVRMVRILYGRGA